jgi:predicted O-methyltransferase YrrM
MSVQSILDYVNARPRGADKPSVAEMYGTESFCLFLYSLLRMEKPDVVVELGAGAGVTTCLAAQALRENDKGHLWTVDSGLDWDKLRAVCQGALGYHDEHERYAAFLARLTAGFEIQARLTHVDESLGETSFFAPAEKIDVVFADAPASDAEGCVQLLRYYLPRMQSYASIFIDRASTINHSYLLLNYFVEQLNAQKIPLHLWADQTAEHQRALRELVTHCRFSIVHLTETSRGKRNPLQNSRAWLRIEPNDYLPHNHVASIVSSSG